MLRLALSHGLRFALWWSRFLPFSEVDRILRFMYGTTVNGVAHGPENSILAGQDKARELEREQGGWLAGFGGNEAGRAVGGAVAKLAATVQGVQERLFGTGPA